MQLRSLTLPFFLLLSVGCECAQPAAQCQADTQCNDGYVCNDGTCEAGCRLLDQRCVGGVCEAGVGCVQCNSDSQCAPGETCHDNSCVPGCSASGTNCPDGTVCAVEQGVCVECTSNAQCHHESLAVCDTATNTCVQCASSADCGGDTPLCDSLSNTCVACVSNTDCAQGVCHQQQCVECLSDAQCGGSTPRCDGASNTCVACLPGATDNCPSGQYCRPDFTCEQGCSNGADCSSGVCLENHSCQGCTSDNECAVGNVCDNGTCIGSCGPGSACGTGETCCNGHCESLQQDANNCGACGIVCGAGAGCCAGACTDTTTLTNCGACGVVCGADQFCDGSQCRDKTFPNFCANQNVVAIRDGITADNLATEVLASTITQYCSSQTNVTFVDDDDPTVVEQTLPGGGKSGRLLLGGTYSIVTAGGPWPNLPVWWLENNTQVTPVYYASNGFNEFYYKRRDPAGDVTLLTKPSSYCDETPKHDVVLVELAIDPSSGTLALIAYGACSGGAGTKAAAWFWAHEMLPNRAQYPGSWYVVEWTDTDGSGDAGQGDTFTVLHHG